MRLSGCGLALCNDRFFVDNIAHRAKEKGLRIIWSSEMMWHHEGECEALREGIIDYVLYVSSIQQRALSPKYRGIPGSIVGNYIDPLLFPFAIRSTSDPLVIGRLSRAVPEKYPEDFPVFYESLQIPNARFRVMAWNDALRRKYRWHSFGRQWDLLTECQETQNNFLRSLDLFIYPLGHTFTESWGRSTAEAMLTGCVPLVPQGHNFTELIEHGVSGYICADFLQWQDYALALASDQHLRKSMSLGARTRAMQIAADRRLHLRQWVDVFQQVYDSPC
ncbi:MAG: glycosyltransferase [Chthoniobacter sp.]|nr:glycosyltransferase [Chthoniobacter sp.]